MNRTFLSGNLTRSPELKLIPDGTAKVCTFGIGVNERYTDRETGEVRDQAHFFECTAWNTTAQNIFDFFKKGMPILIEGSLRQERWQNEAGENRSRVSVRVTRFEFMSQRTDSDNGTPVETPPTRDPQTEPESQPSSNEQPLF